MVLNFLIYLSLLLIVALLLMDICKPDFVQTRFRKYYLRIFKTLAIASIISTIITGIIGINQSTRVPDARALTNVAR